MKQFEDAGGRQWIINLTVGCLRLVKATIGVDLTAPEAIVDELGHPCPDAVSPMTLGQRLTSDVMLFVDVLYACLQESAETKGVSVQQFCAELPPALVRRAQVIFLEEWCLFFHEIGRADREAVIRGAIELQAEMVTQSHNATHRLQAAGVLQIQKDVDKEVNKVLEQLTSGNSSTSTPESSGSTRKR